MCDLDTYRLERIEDHRKGDEPVFWLELWSSLFDKHGQLDSDIRPIRIIIPRDRWVDFLSVVRDENFAILEVAYSTAEAARFEAAINHIKKARSRIDQGEYDEAVGNCRKSIEALCQELEVGNNVDDLLPFLQNRTDDKRAKEYIGIISRIKQLAGYAIHEFGKPVKYSRAEARFVVNTTENILVLVGALSKQLNLY